MGKRDKGNYYKRKTKKWFIKQGYWCDYVERLQRIVTYDKFTKEPKVIFVKQDLAGADLLAMNGEELIFANSKLGRKNIAEGLKEFAKFPYPPFVKRWLVVWEVRAREPEIIEYEEGGDKNV